MGQDRDADDNEFEWVSCRSTWRGMAMDTMFECSSIAAIILRECLRDDLDGEGGQREGETGCTSEHDHKKVWEHTAC